MPELPEVETVRQELRQTIVNSRIIQVQCRRHNLRYPLPKAMATALKNAIILDIERRGKYLLIRLDNDKTIISHLGMSGRFLFVPHSDDSAVNAGNNNNAGNDFAKHDHVIFYLTASDGDSATLIYNDPRRFGMIDIIDSSARHNKLRNLGPEPLADDFSPEWLAARAHNRKTSIKSFLLDQATVAGLGNIYVCEALYTAAISPLHKAEVLADGDGQPNQLSQTLIDAIRQALSLAIEAGGSSLRDYARIDGNKGYFQHQFKVYGRDGEKCLKPDCNSTIKKISQAGRSTFFCPTCQL